MEENKKPITLTQREYQKKYDKKTKMISVKYVLSDMHDYDRLMEYLEKTGQSTNSFIKMLINGFFKKGYDRYEYPVPKEYERREYYKYACISDEYFEKLKSILGDDEEKYNMVLDHYADCIKEELEYAFEEKGYAFEEWVDNLEESINNGEINLNLSERDFREIIKESMDQFIREIMYG